MSGDPEGTAIPAEAGSIFPPAQNRGNGGAGEVDDPLVRRLAFVSERSELTKAGAPRAKRAVIPTAPPFRLRLLHDRCNQPVHLGAIFEVIQQVVSRLLIHCTRTHSRSPC